KVLELVAMRALAKSPADRFAAAVEFRSALEASLERSDDASADEAVLCDGCCLRVSKLFKFCPECGYRLSTGTIVDTLTDIVTERVPAAPPLDRLPTLTAAPPTDMDLL